MHKRILEKYAFFAHDAGPIAVMTMPRETRRRRRRYGHGRWPKPRASNGSVGHVLARLHASRQPNAIALRNDEST